MRKIVPTSLGRVLVLAPHFDDAVLSCGHLLAQLANVEAVTVMGGIPLDAMQQTSWDRTCGFASAHDTVVTRRMEEAAALSELGGKSSFLDICDHQYGQHETSEKLRDLLASVFSISSYDTLLSPLGLTHPDHMLVSDAAQPLWSAFNGTVIVYEEIPYRENRELVDLRLAQLRSRGAHLVVTEVSSTDGSRRLKKQAMDCYHSQRRGYGPQWAPMLDQSERYWIVSL